MEQFIQHILQVMGTVPAVAVYGIIAVWVGLESSGIGLPIEPLMLFAGSLTTQAQSDVNLILAIVAASAGCLIFSSVAYIIGDRLGTPAIARVGRYVGLTQARADHIELWLQHRGAFGVFIARETPIVRTYGSFIMGAAKIGLPTFVLGTASWLAALLWRCHRDWRGARQELHPRHRVLPAIWRHRLHSGGCHLARGAGHPSFLGAADTTSYCAPLPSSPCAPQASHRVGGRHGATVASIVFPA